MNRRLYFSRPFWLMLGVAFLTVVLILVVPLFLVGGRDSAELVPSAKNPDRPLALVYRGEASCSDCAEAVAALLQSSQWHFEVKYVGPHEKLHLSAALLKVATLYAQPGSDEDTDLDTAFRMIRSDAPLIRDFVKSGGHYLGFCMGGYLAGATPGLQLLPGDTRQFIKSPQASVRTTADTTVQVSWRDQLRTVHFQDAPYFILNPDALSTTVLARYTNDTIAALVTPYGQGRVGVVGPHIEATADWYRAYHLTAPQGLTLDLGQDLINTVMKAD